MSVIIRVPGSLKDWFQGDDEAVCQGETMGECLEYLIGRFPDLRDRLFDKNSELSAVLVFLNGENILSLEGLATPVKDGDEAGIIPLAAGG
jgi:molybdopterin converting factor small subunit